MYIFNSRNDRDKQISKGGTHISRKYIYKNKIPKSLIHKQKARVMGKKVDRVIDKKNNAQTYTSKPHYRSNQTSTWKIPAVLFIVSLSVLILIIPTLIVIPFVQQEKIAEDTTQKNEQLVIKDSSTPVSVAVMRNQSNEIDNIPLEEYVVGVVAAEMGADFEKEALKAQGIAARTYIVNHLLSTANQNDKNVSDTTSDQVYKDEAELRKAWGSMYNEKIERLTEAVLATEGKIITYGNAPIFPAYFSTSNGFTENSEEYWENELPYLRSVQSKWDEESPKFLDQKVYTIAEVAEKLNVALSIDQVISMEIIRTDSDRVSQLSVAGNSFSGREVREKLGLQSSDFKIEQNNEHLIFTTKGFGHGIGMSQYGANGMAKEGKDYQEIIKYYYKDVEISTLTETAPTLVAR